MFCPFCGRQNQNDVLFCTKCGKAMPKKNSLLPSIEPIVQPHSNPKTVSAPKVRVSHTAIKALITGVLIVGLIIVVLLIYYPGVFPWNWG